ncbi:hypothetical protein GJW-30_1_03008 [Variibacter gotjawalensis]|uniref:Right handed beta helix domain-containing protein n=1 Tax=Variibacter gotjawalensis TaxID=1333996 RepID=A0A0S3PX12_9BRAD|nr:parallel beta helix pectate lyase-like protein [Variibacter gotjawalensis]BAT60465.1 hypothetical protein GJW-30_1_03008 [Variibacter gotjawalensis]
MGHSASAAIVIRVDPAAVQQPARKTSTATVGDLNAALALVSRVWTGAARNRSAVIEFAGGIHRFDQTIRIGLEFSGRADAPLILRGATDGSSRLSGSVPLTQTSVDVPARLDPLVRDRVVAYRLPPSAAEQSSIGVHRYHPAPSNPAGIELFDAQGALQPARWPNQGWSRVGQAKALGQDAVIAVEGGRSDRWVGEPDLWVAGYLGQDWSFETIAATSSIPGSQRLGLVKAPHYPLRSGDRLFVEHALSELDTPGEWWRDRDSGIVFLIPRSSTSSIEASVAPTLIAIDGAKHVLIEGLTFERSRGDAVTVTGGEDVVFQDCTFRWIAGRGLVIDGAKRSGLRRSVVADMGEGGVSLKGGTRATLTRADNFVEDSFLVRYARLGRTYKDAVAIDGVGMRVTGNVIAHAPHLAIRYQGNDHLIAANEIFDVVNDTSDSGAIYSGRDVSAQGTVIRGNFIHDVLPAKGEGQERFEVKGVYLDDLASGTTIEDNVFLRVEQPVFVGGGRDNVVARNVFVASSPALFIDGRGKVWPQAPFDEPGNAFYATLREVPVSSTLWASRYPALARIMTDDPYAAKRNVFRDNLIVASRAEQIGDGARPEEQNVSGNRTIDKVPPIRTSDDLARWLTQNGMKTLPEGINRFGHLLNNTSLRSRASDAGVGGPER